MVYLTQHPFLHVFLLQNYTSDADHGRLPNRCFVISAFAIVKGRSYVWISPSPPSPTLVFALKGADTLTALIKRFRLFFSSCIPFYYNRSNKEHGSRTTVLKLCLCHGRVYWVGWLPPLKASKSAWSKYPDIPSPMVVQACDRPIER